jgi:integrase
MNLFFQFRSNLGLSLKAPFLKGEIEEFLQFRAGVVQQRQLDGERILLAKIFNVTLEKFIASRATFLESRAVDWGTVQKIMEHQTPLNRIATLVAYDAGLRANALAGLRRASEARPSAHRTWRPDIFACRNEHVLYVIVNDKGGLSHPVSLHHHTAAELEKFRLAEPKVVTDRGIHRKMLYGIGYGQAWSQSFSAASIAVTGKSTGAHGLRHAYAQRRYCVLRKAGFSEIDCLTLVSQELGHFRPEVTLAYFR